MARAPLGPDPDKRPLPGTGQAANDPHPAWIGFLGGVVVLGFAIVIALAIWHFADSPTSQLTTAELTEAEVLLDQLGFPPGPIDGVIDEETSNAIRDFQVTAGLEVDGQLELGLLDELRAAKAETSSK